MYIKTRRPWLRSFAAEAPGGGSSPKPDADRLTDLANGTTPPEQGSGSETPDPDETPEGGSETPGDTKETWEDHFPDQTPAAAKASLDEWKKRSREWEKRSKENHTALEKLRAESGTEGSADLLATTQLQGELHLYQDVIAYAISNGTAAQIPDLVDSVSFRQAHALLDREDEDYETKLGELITKRLGPAPAPVERAPHQTNGTETYRDHSKTVGDQLYEELYGTK